jgi:hypothetical protein
MRIRGEVTLIKINKSDLMSIIKKLKTQKHDDALDIVSNGSFTHEVDPATNRNLLHMCVVHQSHPVLEELLKPEHGLRSELQVKDRLGEVC